MTNKEILSIQFEGYKSFPTGVANEIIISPHVSVLIGKNNCGKSSCIDVIECVFKPDYYPTVRSNFSRISPIFTLGNYNISYGFSKTTGGGDIPGTLGSNYYAYGSQFIGNKIVTDLSVIASGKDRYTTLKFSNTQIELDPSIGQSQWENTTKTYKDFQQNYEFRRINAERDLVAEVESPQEFVDYNGNGATNLLRKFINHSLYDEKLVEERLLEELNKIMEPDSHFQKIRVQQIDDDGIVKWEIFLEEDNGKRFALSKSGSGLKTIILMLINLYIIPEIKGYQDRKIVFAFEELENNLHPALQRKVFEYLYDFAVENDTHIFITTHSHIAINTFFEKDNTALYHVQKSNGEMVTHILLIDFP